MAQVISLPNGHEISFPDNMNENEITDVIHREYPEYKPKQEQKSPDIFLKSAMNYEKALGLGLAQGAGDVGASIANFPGDIYGYFAGKSPYHIPHPALQQYYPKGDAGDFGSTIGEAIGNLVAPAGAAIKAGRLATSPLSRMLMSSLGGGIAGAASQEDNRGLGGALGASIGGIGAAIPESIDAIKSLTSSFTPRHAADLLQKQYNATDEALSSAFKHVGKIAEEEGVSKIPLNKKILSDIKEVGPKTGTFEKFVDKAKSGNYQDLRRLQTELFKRGNKANSSPLLSEQDVGARLHELRDKINEGISSHFEKKGKPELAQQLQEAMGGYKNLMRTYHSEPTISKVVGEEKKVPKSLNKKLLEDSAAMDRIRSEHPELTEKLMAQSHKDKQKALVKALLPLAGTGGFVGAGYYGAKKLFE